MADKYYETIGQTASAMVENLNDIFGSVRKFRPQTTPEEFMEDVFRYFQPKFDRMKENMCDDYYDGKE